MLSSQKLYVPLGVKFNLNAKHPAVRNNLLQPYIIRYPFVAVEIEFYQAGNAAKISTRKNVMKNQNSSGPLKGVTVVELGTYVAIPVAARILADFGATVVKVEDIKGEDWRKMGKAHFNMPVTADENVLFTAINTNKKLVALDLKNSDAMCVMHNLLKNADIFMTSVRMKSLEKMGLDYETLKKEYPELVYVHLTGYGYEGPDAKRPGFDMAAFSARSGALLDWVAEDSLPCKPITAFGDMVTSNVLLAGLLSALYAKAQTGKGTLVATSLYGAGIWNNSCGILASQDCFDNTFPKSRYAPMNPFSHFYQCKDRKWLNITILAYEPAREKLLTALGMEAYLNDPRFDTIASVKANVVDVVSLLDEHFMQKTSEEWSGILHDNDLVFEKLVHFKDVAEDPQAIANSYLQETTYATGTTVKMPRYPVFFSEYETKNVVPSGGIGQDTDEVLTGLHYSPDEIGRMKNSNAVR